MTSDCRTWTEGDLSIPKCLKCQACLLEEIKIRDNEISRLKERLRESKGERKL